MILNLKQNVLHYVLVVMKIQNIVNGNLFLNLSVTKMFLKTMSSFNVSYNNKLSFINHLLYFCIYSDCLQLYVNCADRLGCGNIVGRQVLFAEYACMQRQPAFDARHSDGRYFFFEWNWF
jgi:hypothetical protein